MTRTDDGRALVVTGAAGGRAIAVQADVAIGSEVIRLFETCDAELGRLWWRGDGSPQVADPGPRTRTYTPHLRRHR